MHELRYSAAHLLGAALIELFPETRLLGGGPCSKGFYFDCALPFSFETPMLPLVERKMKELPAREEQPSCMEMMSSNAADYLQHKRQEGLSLQAAQSEATCLSLIQWGTYLALEETLPTFQELKWFRLVEFKKLQKMPWGEGLRIYGAVSSTKEALKEFLRANPRLAMDDGMAIGSRMNFWISQGKRLLWLPKGEKLRDQILRSWRTFAQKRGFSLLFSGLDNLEATRLAHLESQLAATAEFGHFAQDLLLQRSKEEHLLSCSISSLNLIRDFSKLYSFEFKWFFCAGTRPRRLQKTIENVEQALQLAEIKYRIDPSNGGKDRIEVQARMRDELGRQWLMARMQVIPLHSGEVCISSSLCVSLERWVASLLEKKQGWLPFWLSSVQVKMMVIEGCAVYAAKVEALLDELSLRRERLDLSKRELGAAMSAALCEKIPYVMVIGNQEVEKEIVSVRAYGSEQVVAIPIQRLKETFNKEKRFESQ